MRRGLFEDSSSFTKLIMLLFVMMACFLIVMLAATLLAPLILGVSLADVMNGLSGRSEPSNLNLLRYMQSLQHIGLFIIPAFFAAYLFSGHTVRYLRLNRGLSAKWYGLMALMMLASVPFINLLATLNEMIVFPQSLSGLEQRLKLFEESAQQFTLLFLNVDNVGAMLFNIFMIAILPAIGEELIFRGLIQRIIAQWTDSIHLAIVVSAFLFSLMHLQFYGFFPRWLLGIVFGYLLFWSGTLWLPIFAHFLNNAVAVLLSFLIYRGVIPESIENIGSNWADIPVTAFATALCAWLLWKMYRKDLIYKYKY